MDNSLIIEIEEFLNKKNFNSVDSTCYADTTLKYDSKILELIDSEVNNTVYVSAEKSIYDIVITYIKRMNDPRFLKKNGEVKEAGFYRYAYIDKSTWSDMKWKKIKIKKKTLLKLILALNLNREQAEELLSQGGEKFDFSNFQDKLILAIIEIRKVHTLDVEDIAEIIFEYQDMYHDTQPFDSIYETAEMIAERKGVSL